MAAKKIQISIDNEVTYLTLPGSTGDYREELATNTDTVFGQTFQSQDVSIGQWTVTSNAFFKGIQGYIANLKQAGTPTTMTAEAMSLVSGKTYQVTNTAKRIIDYNTVVQVFDNAVDHTADVVSVDYLSGQVTFASTYVVAGPVTITGKYVPLVAIANARSFTLNMNAASIDTTDYETARTNGGWRTFIPGLRTVTLELGGIYNVTNGWSAALASRNMLVIEISPDNTTDTLFRGFFKPANNSQTGDVGALEATTQNFNLFVPDGQLLSAPFGWYFTGNTKMSPSLKNLISAWQSQIVFYTKYLPDGGTTPNAGHKGQSIITSFSLANTLEGLNEFRVTLQGSGTPAAV